MKPVAWRFYERNMWCYVDHLTDLPQDKFEPLYPAPQKREWVGLTRDEVEQWELPFFPTVYEFAQFVEAKLKEKNT